MIDRTDFEKKLMIFYYASEGEKLSFKNDNIIVTGAEGQIKLQTTCYRVFIVFVIGDTTITTGLLQRADKFGFSLCLFNRNFKMYKMIASRMDGNTVLRNLQYSYKSLDLARFLVRNKITNQLEILSRTRMKNPAAVEAKSFLKNQIEKLNNGDLPLSSIMGIEGSAARVYFEQIFSNTKWVCRRPRIKADYVNACLDIGYTIAFNLMDALLGVYGFDTYCGVMHTFFYMRKSLVCDMMEPLRPIIDYTIRKGINLGQISEEDFEVVNLKYCLKWKASPKYTKLFLEALLEYKNEIFLFVQGYYRSFMKSKSADEYKMLLIN